MKINRYITFVLIMVIAKLSAQQPGTLKWSFMTGGRVSSSPAIGPDGTVYMGSGDNKLYALNPDGTKKWSISGGIISCFVIGADGTVFGTSPTAGISPTNVYALNPDGTLKWSVYGIRGRPPAIGSDGTLYVGGTNFILTALNPDGTEKLSFTSNDKIYTSPVIGHDGTVYVGTSFSLKALNPDGKEKWSFKIDGFIRSSPAIGSDGTIYAGPWDNKLYAINPDGTEKWSFTTNDWINTSPVIGPDGTIYVGSQDFKLYALNPDGTKKWSFVTGSQITSSPAIGSDSTVYLGSYDGKVYALNPDGTEKWSFETGGPIASCPAIGTDGTLYIGSSDGMLAIHTSSKGLAQSPWPKFMKDNQNRANMQLQFPPDHIAPSPVSDLSVKKLSDGEFKLLWTAPGDDNNLGNASNYNIRFSTSAPDTNLDSWWLRTCRVANMPKPASADSRDSVLIGNFQEGTYYFAIKVGDEVGNWSPLSNIVEVSIHITGITTIDKFPTKYHLFQNYPNPFNPTTHISFRLDKTADVTLIIYNSFGQIIKTLVNDNFTAGSHSVQWDGTNDSGVKVVSGVYFYRLVTDHQSKTRKMLLLQ